MTQRHRDTGTRGHGDTVTQRHGDTGTQRHGDADTDRRHGDAALSPNGTTPARCEPPEALPAATGPPEAGPPACSRQRPGLLPAAARGRASCLQPPEAGPPACSYRPAIEPPAHPPHLSLCATGPRSRRTGRACSQRLASRSAHAAPRPMRNQARPGTVARRVPTTRPLTTSRGLRVYAAPSLRPRRYLIQQPQRRYRQHYPAAKTSSHIICSLLAGGEK